MKRYIWLVSYLVKDENGDVAGYKTAFEAPDPIMACMQAGDFFRVTNEPESETLITSVGLADDESAELIGEVVVDTLAIDWPK